MTKPVQMTFDRLEDRKAALGKRRLLKLREQCVHQSKGHDWASLADYPGVLQDLPSVPLGQVSAAKSTIRLFGTLRALARQMITRT